MSSDSLTQVTLLARLQRDPHDQAAWQQFVDRYGRQVYRWCRHWKLTEVDAEDVTQMVLLKLAEKLRSFVYDPSRSFRGWLRTLTQHAWSDFLASQQRPGHGSGDTAALTALASVAARDDLVQHLNEQFDQDLLEEAMNRVRARVQPTTWEAFRLLAMEGVSGAEAAERLGLKVATVFVHRSNVQKMLREEVRQMEESA